MFRFRNGPRLSTPGLWPRGRASALCRPRPFMLVVDGRGADSWTRSVRVPPFAVGSGRSSWSSAVVVSTVLPPRPVNVARVRRAWPAVRRRLSAGPPCGRRAAPPVAPPLLRGRAGSRRFLLRRDPASSGRPPPPPPPPLPPPPPPPPPPPGGSFPVARRSLVLSGGPPWTRRFSWPVPASRLPPPGLLGAPVARVPAPQSLATLGGRLLARWVSPLPSRRPGPRPGRPVAPVPVPGGSRPRPSLVASRLPPGLPWSRRRAVASCVFAPVGSGGIPASSGRLCPLCRAGSPCRSAGPWGPSGCWSARPGRLLVATGSVGAGWSFR